MTIPKKFTPYLVAAAAVFSTSSASAANYSVSSDGDANTSGTLRYALNQLASNCDPSNTIKFKAAYNIVVSSPLPTIQCPVKVLGGDSTIRPDSSFSGDEVLKIDLGGSGEWVEIYDVAFTDGGNSSFRALTALDDMILRLEDVRIEGYGDLGVKGGGLSSTAGIVQLIGSRFAHNEGSTGGAVRVAEAGLLSIEDCGFDHNRSSGEGAGVYVEGPDVTVEVRKSYFHDNETTSGIGGALLVLDQPGLSTSMVYIEDSTFYENGAGLAGADVGMTGIGGSPTLTVVNSTFVDARTAWTGLSLSVLDPGATVEIYDSVIAPSYPTTGPAFGCLFYTTAFAAEGNIGTADTGSMPHSCGLDQPNNQVMLRSEIRLSCTDASPPAWASPPFQMFGGAETKTCTPLCESPVIDASQSGFATSEDQRGFGIEGSARDVGAHELSSGDNPGVSDPATCEEGPTCGNGMIEAGEQCEQSFDCPQPDPFVPMLCQNCQCVFPVND